ncbi:MULTISPECIES: hypothetical protein [unclassified Thioalkalivibrio]|uniref:hypothetical protein n=1 Tax=unclassified Thioalkalivibrio TaxID=2621013 RepID=UPI0012DF6B1A|nr:MULTISPECIES: hypothetical protein [unclassified Thioalkalivibrio]
MNYSRDRILTGISNRVFNSGLFVRVRHIHNRATYGEGFPRQERAIVVDPSRISNKILTQTFGKRPPRGSVIGGGWDKASVPVKESWKYKVLYKRFLLSLSWGQAVRRALEEGQSATGLVQLVSDDDRLKAWQRKNERLWQSLKKTGIEASRGGLLVHVGRDGEIYGSHEGNHRLVMAQLMGLPSAPALVCVRHESWVMYRQQVARSLSGAPGVTHPDLQDLGCEERG